MKNKIELSQKQQDAVDYNNGPLRLIAGPGAGKTRVLVQKIIKIIENFPNAEERILVITFTNKAVGEIKKRLKKEGFNVPGIFTYHGFCGRLIRNESQYSGIDSEWESIDGNDMKRYINEILKENFSKSEISSKDHLKIYALTQFFGNYEFNKKWVEKNKYNQWFEESELIYTDYKKFKKKRKLLDYNDLLLVARNTLRQHKEVREKYNNQYQFVMVDEFQDTNDIQYEILKYFNDENSYITIVGDIDQNIYSWRGANANIMLNFDNDFKTTKTIYMDTNYRSVDEIVNASKLLIKNNKDRVEDFEPIHNRTDKGELTWTKFNEYEEEAGSIAKKIKGLIKLGETPEEIAIIVRISRYTRLIEAKLRENDIDYKIVGAFKFFERKEVKDSINFMRVLTNPDNDLHMENLMIDCVKGVGKDAVSKLKSLRTQQNLTMFEVMKNVQINNKKIIEFRDILIRNRNKLFEHITSNTTHYIGQVLWMFMEDVQYLRKDKEFEQQFENIKEFVNLVKERERSFTQYGVITNEHKREISVGLDNVSLETYAKERLLGAKTFIDEISLASAGDESEDNGKVIILTAHASKGTEFNNVFIPAFNSGHWPSSMAKEPDELEEERRVAYVGITRAKTNLWISNCKNVGMNQPPAIQSPYLTEMGLSDKPTEKSSKSVSCPFCGEGRVVEKVNRWGKEFWGCNQWPRCNAILEPGHFNNLYETEQEKLRREAPDFKVEDDTTKVENHFNGRIVSHSSFGRGKIISNDGDFVEIEFESGEKEEIIIGHSSYTFAKGEN